MIRQRGREEARLASLERPANNTVRMERVGMREVNNTVCV